jgi:hypothetical protein
MSSWVAPSVAAEIWGISVDQVLAGIADGSIPSYVDGQFLFVDVRGQSITPSSSRSSPTEGVVTEEEFAALTFQPRESDVILPSDDEPADEPEEENVRDIGSWRAARQQSARTRRPPQANAA